MEETKLINSHLAVVLLFLGVCCSVIIYAIGEWISGNVRLSDYARKYMVRLVRNTRPHRVRGAARTFVRDSVEVGDSPRVEFHLEAVAKTFAFFAGTKIVTPDHVKAVAEMVLAHRLVLKEGLEFTTTVRKVLREILRLTEVPPWN